MEARADARYVLGFVAPEPARLAQAAVAEDSDDEMGMTLSEAAEDSDDVESLAPTRGDGSPPLLCGVGCWCRRHLRGKASAWREKAFAWRAKVSAWHRRRLRRLQRPTRHAKLCSMNCRCRHSL